MSGGEGMIVRNGVRSTLRARGRSVLFTLLILLLTLALTLGLGMWSYCARTLAAMDGQYTSVALVEYMGQNYPDADTADDYARQAAQALDGDAIAAIDGVELWESTDQALAALSGYSRVDGALPYEDYGVVVATSFSPMYGSGIQWLEGEVTLPEACLVMNTMSMDFTYYAPGLEPLVVPNYNIIEYTAEGSPDGVARTALFRYVLNEDGETVMDEVEEGEIIEEPWMLSGELMGTIPAAYRQGEDTLYYYDPITDQYGVWGRVISGYSCSIVDGLYLPSDQRDGVLAIVDPGETDFVPQRGTRYLLHGVFTFGASANTTFLLTTFSEEDDTPPYLALSGTDDPALTESIFVDWADYYRAMNSYVRLEASDQISALEPFQQQALFLSEGRFPQPGEAGVCVLDGRTAGQMGLSVGDTLELTMLSAGQENRFDLTVDEETRTLEIVGITNDAQDYAGCVWVSCAEGGFGQPRFGYNLGRAVLDNAKGRQAADALQAMAPEGVRVTLYDQGYSTAAQPLRAMESTALAVTAACACGALAVLLLFGYLFVGRQRETVEVLTCLGTPRGKIRLWLVSGAVVIAGCAAVLGALIGRLTMGRILQAALSAAQGLYAVDQRYSEAAIGVAQAAPEMGELPWWPALAAALAVFCTALALCLAFLSLARRKAVRKQGKSTVRVPKGGTSTTGQGAARFALLSVRRGGWRSGVVPAVALALALLLGVMTSTAQGWDEQMDTLYDTTVITGEVTSLNGRQATNLSVSARNARLLWESGLMEEIYVSKGWPYWSWVDMPEFSDTSFGMESMNAWISQQPQLVALNDLSAAPAFYYGEEPQVEWLEGWDESFLSDTEYYSILDSMDFYFNQSQLNGGKPSLTYPCLVSQEFLEQMELELGDGFNRQIRIPVLSQNYNEVVSLQVVGAYSGAGGQREIYVPLSFWCELDWIVGEEALLAEGERPNSNFTDAAGRDAFFYWNTNLSTCRFTLDSARDLNALRDYLEGQNFTQVGKITSNRTNVVLRDQAFVETVAGLGRYITFSQILLPALCGAVGLLGFIVSWLMVNGRRMEFAVLRGLGASKGRVFATFFLEQGALALLGCVVGSVLLTLLGGGWVGWLAAAAFLVCYLIGCALAVAAVGRTNLMSLLSERE